jgi:hypothetical protein
MAEKANIIIDQGTTFSTTVTITNANGSVFNLSGYTAAAQMRKSYAAANSTSFNVTIAANSQTGVVTMEMAANVTQSLTAGRYVYDLETYSSSNTTVSRILEGIVTVTPGVTRGNTETV